MYKVNRICGKKGKRFLVEWEGGEVTAEPKKNLINCSVFQEYIAKSSNREAFSTNEKCEIIHSQNNKCNLCLTNLSYCEIDHLIPLKAGGTNKKGNLQALCKPCHIFKTSVLDSVIKKMLQVDPSVGRNKILRACQIHYRTKNKIPSYQEDIFKLALDMADMFEQSMVNMKIEPTTKKRKINPPVAERKSSYLNNLVHLINNSIAIGVKENTLKMKTCQLYFDFDDKPRLTDSEIYKKLNEFFKKIHKENKNRNVVIGNVRVRYIKN